jgi:hypothetical protein
VSTSNTPDEGDWADFDVIEFARATIKSIEYGDAMNSVLEERVIRLEEIVAVRWPRSMLVRWRLAREIRASAATWDPRYIPRNDFRARRYETVSLQSSDLYNRRPHNPADWGAEAARPPEDDSTDPGEGFLS